MVVNNELERIVEGCGPGLIEGTTPEISGGTEENHKKLSQVRLRAEI
jgi:hypothetical protein